MVERALKFRVMKIIAAKEIKGFMGCSFFVNFTIKIGVFYLHSLFTQ